MSFYILTDEFIFPHPTRALADPNGLLAVGGDLSAARLKLAYQQGIFPWYSEDEPILWWSPDPRAVLDPKQFYISRSFKKFIKQCDYQVTINHDFAGVIRACSVNHGDTWITSQIIDSYIELHQLGFAHSVEVWQNSELIGGLYGIAQGSLFCGESMFSVQTNASKIGLYAFCQHFISQGGALIDCQVLNDHTESLGAFDIPRADYLNYLAQLQTDIIDPNCYSQQHLNYKY